MTYTSYIAEGNYDRETNIIRYGEYLTVGETLALLQQHTELLAACRAARSHLMKTSAVSNYRSDADLHDEHARQLQMAISNAEETK